MKGYGILKEQLEVVLVDETGWVRQDRSLRDCILC